MSFRAILLVIPNYLQGIGDARASFLCTATGTVLFPPAFIVGCYWGITGICIAWVLVYPVMFCINAMIASRYGRLSVKALLLTPLPPLASGIAMLLAVMALRPHLGGPEVDRIGMLVAAGATVYVSVMLFAFRPQAMELVAIVNTRRRAV